MKEMTIKSQTPFACTCGAVPYDPEKRPNGKVGLTKYRKSKCARDGGWSVVCASCGRVGERDYTQIGAIDKWNLRRFKYGPLKEENE
mgnify:CR=1 FL=1